MRQRRGLNFKTQRIMQGYRGYGVNLGSVIYTSFFLFYVFFVYFRICAGFLTEIYDVHPARISATIV